ncbi:MAG: tRNA (adenosine(37)-N6)-threonylcarbamoyltransferase complex transferase subunit TsaD [bacterium]
MLTLGIETSCDETAVAVLDQDYRVLSNLIYSQSCHKDFGGVVPEIASREHLLKINSLCIAALHSAGVDLSQIGLIAATAGPGLLGALIVGLSYAKGLAYSLDIPLIGVNHIYAHITANRVEYPYLEFPFLALVISGGHTMLLDCISSNNYSLLGTTVDDAAGEAFDKIGKLMGLDYPCGSKFAELAHKGEPDFHKFPRAMINSGDLNFSFSGLKTAVINYIKSKEPVFLIENECNIFASIQEAMVEVLERKCKNAIKQLGYKKLVLAGGVACNKRLKSVLKSGLKGCQLFFPRNELCTDNGAMIAAHGILQYKSGTFENRLDVQPFSTFNKLT